MSKISFKKALAAVVLLGMVAGTAFVLGSCGKEKTNTQTIIQWTTKRQQ